MVGRRGVARNRVVCPRAAGHTRELLGPSWFNATGPRSPANLIRERPERLTPPLGPPIRHRGIQSLTAIVLPSLTFNLRLVLVRNRDDAPIPWRYLVMRGEMRPALDGQ